MYNFVVLETRVFFTNFLLNFRQFVEGGVLLLLPDFHCHFQMRFIRP